MNRQRSGFYAHQRAYNNCCSRINPNVNKDIYRGGLILYFDVNDSSSYGGSGDIWNNIGDGGTTYDARLTGNPKPSFVSGSIKSFLFTGHLLETTSDYLSYNCMTLLNPANSLTFDYGSFTYCAWIKTTAVGYGLNHNTLRYIISAEVSGTDDDFGFGIDMNGKLTYGDGKEGGINLTVHSNTSVNTGDWTFVAVTRNIISGRVCLYINGFLDKVGSCNVGNALDASQYMIIGSEADFIGYTFDGNLGTILGYNKVLLQSQIVNNYNVQKASYGL